jgi:hypothetical protein
MIRNSGNRFSEEIMLKQDENKTAGEAPAVSNPLLRGADHTAAVIHCCSFCFGAAPT